MARLYRDHVQPFAHQVTTDVLGDVTFRFRYAGHMGRLDLGKGPGISQGGVNTNLVVFDMLIASA